MPRHTPTSIAHTLTALEDIRDYAEHAIADLEHDAEDATDEHAIVAACNLLDTFVNAEAASMISCFMNFTD